MIYCPLPQDPKGVEDWRYPHIFWTAFNLFNRRRVEPCGPAQGNEFAFGVSTIECWKSVALAPSPQFVGKTVKPGWRHLCDAWYVVQSIRSLGQEESSGFKSPVDFAEHSDRVRQVLKHVVRKDKIKAI